MNNLIKSNYKIEIMPNRSDSWALFFTKPQIYKNCIYNIYI